MNNPPIQFNENGIQPIKEASDLAESLQELNNDFQEPNSRMSGIDLRTRLHFTEIPSILACDTLVAFNMLPQECLNFTRQKKRLAVSINGKGRSEIVDLVRGKKEQDEGRSAFDRIKGFMGVNK